MNALRTVRMLHLRNSNPGVSHFSGSLHTLPLWDRGRDTYMLACPIDWNKTGTSNASANVTCPAKAENEDLASYLSQKCPSLGTLKQYLRGEVSQSCGTPVGQNLSRR